MVDPNTRQGKRTPVTLKIKFKSETLEQFIERYAVDVSQGGIFIRTKEPLAVGTQMRFEFQLRDASPLIAGEGTVVWTRENDPSRPAIAPGMGVRFDRLAEGSQGVLERILSEKAKQAPQRSGSESTKPPMFTDTPTRVAPAPVQEALLGGESRPTRKRPDSFGDSGTPLPRPMPFHSDADDFDEQAFEEATKVRALDELIAQTAGAASGDTTTDMPADELAARRAVTRAEDPAPADTTAPAPYTERDSAPSLPSPPVEPSRPNPKILDTTPSPRSEPSQPPVNTASTPAYQAPTGEAAKTRLGMEPAKVRSSPSVQPANTTSTARSTGETPAITAPPVVARDAATKPSGVRAVAAEPRETEPVPTQKSGGMVGIVILLLLLVAAAGAAVWFFVLREQATDNAVATSNPPPPPPDPGSGSGSAAAVDTGSGSAGSGSAVVVDSGSAGSGSAVEAVQPTPPVAELVDTSITASVDKAEIEIVDTEHKGPSPLKVKLEKGKAYKARIVATGFAPLQVEFAGGDTIAKSKAVLVAKPRVIAVTSDPPGALIFIDGMNTAKTTPFDLELTKAQALRKTTRVSIRKAGFKGVDVVIDAAKWVEDSGKMTATATASLEKAAVVVRPQPPVTNAGSDAAPGSGSGTPTPEPSNGSATEPTPTPTPTPAPTNGAGSGASSPPAAQPSAGGAPKEPEPDFVTKP